MTVIRAVIGKAKRELVADFTIGESDDVGGIAINIVYGGVFDALPDIMSATREAQSLLSRRFISGIRPSSSVTTADAGGTTLLGLGASGSS